MWLALVVALAAGAFVGQTRAQVGGQQGILNPQPIFRSPEDVSKTGVPPDSIKAGVLPDYVSLRNPPVVLQVLGKVYFIGGAGANIAMHVSDEGVVLVDSGVAQASGQVISIVRQYGTRPLRWIINTSADLSNTGGNAAIASSIIPPVPAGGVAPAAGRGGGQGGNGAGIIAHENVLNRMSAPTGQQAARPTEDWPTDTFFPAKKTFWYGGEPIEFLHQPAAHTDGDVMVWFRKSDVVVAGNLLAYDRYPFIDADKGGSIQGILDALNKIVDIAVPEYNQQGGTRIIPGYGRILNETDVVDYRDMATITRDRIRAMVRKNMTLEQVKAARPTLEYDALYGAPTGVWTKDMYIDEVYKETAAAWQAEQAKAAPPAPARRR
jgi:glyoxylase-like metal-dependent hydrolase (beta-lactamase superfamily II)